MNTKTTSNTNSITYSTASTSYNCYTDNGTSYSRSNHETTSSSAYPPNYGTGTCEVDSSGNRRWTFTSYDFFGNKITKIETERRDELGTLIETKTIKENKDGTTQMVDETSSYKKDETYNKYEYIFETKEDKEKYKDVNCGSPKEKEKEKVYKKSGCWTVKETNNLGLVGLFKCKSGVVAFGDYKATSIIDGDLIYEANRDAQKVFKNDNFVFATYGNNEVHYDRAVSRMEYYIEKNLKSDDTWESFFDKFASNTKHFLLTYKFLVAIRKDNDYEFFLLEIKEGKVAKTAFPDNKCMVCGGEEKYNKAMSSLTIDYEIELDEAIKKIEKAFKALINFYSVENERQTVGTNSKGEISIITFK